MVNQKNNRFVCALTRRLPELRESERNLHKISEKYLSRCVAVRILLNHRLTFRHRLRLLCLIIFINQPEVSLIAQRKR
jgi:hypothetical protein